MALENVDDVWYSDATDALKISLVKPSKLGELHTIVPKFTPKFTYPIFGDDERIFGYQGLTVNLQYHATDMRPHVFVSYAKKFRSIGETEAADIPELLKDFLPEVAFQRSKEFEESIKATSNDWSPPGELLRSFEAADGTYEVWKGSLVDPAVKQLVNRIQILVPLFIEGGSFIGTEDSDALDRWTIFFLYRKRHGASSTTSPYEFAGYSTVYRFFFYKPSMSGERSETQDLTLPYGNFSLSELPTRARISQFLLLPPFQGKGMASRLYSTIFMHYFQNPQTTEITVEDPNEAFDDLRDMADRAYLLNDPEFRNLKINTAVVVPKKGPSPRNIVDATALETLRLKTKIAPRQFHRLVEMHLMSRLPNSIQPRIEERSEYTATQAEEHEYKLWKLLVKQRLYRHNKELLGQLERDERIQKLEETLRAVEMEYARILSTFARRGKQAEEQAGKRKLDDHNGEPASKKARVEDAT